MSPSRAAWDWLRRSRWVLSVLAARQHSLAGHRSSFLSGDPAGTGQGSLGQGLPWCKTRFS